MSGGATEWEDILIQQGILKAPPKPEDSHPEIVYNVSDKKEMFSDSLDELDDDEFYNQYRKQRIDELRGTKPIKATFGQVIEISRPDFVSEVTETSRTHFVLVHLYQSGLATCQLVSRALRSLCQEYPQIKFVEIVSTRCIEKYPEALLPTILVYKDTNVYQQVTMATPELVKKTLDVIQQHLDAQIED